MLIVSARLYFLSRSTFRTKIHSTFFTIHFLHHISLLCCFFPVVIFISSNSVIFYSLSYQLCYIKVISFSFLIHFIYMYVISVFFILFYLSYFSYFHSVIFVVLVLIKLSYFYHIYINLTLVYNLNIKIRFLVISF